MNTNQEKRMDKERIAELREEIARNKATGYHDEGIGTFDSPTMDAALDAIESTHAELATAREVIEESMEARRASEAEGGALNQLNNEIDRLRAELAALRGQAGGVVPELADEEVDAYMWSRNHGLVDSDEDWTRWSRRVGRWAYALAVSRLPSSRVAGEGEVVVPAGEWAAMSAIGYDPEPCRHDHHGYCQEHGWFSLEPCPTGIMQRLRAANEKGEATPAAPDPAP